jgi:hypothetical protein
MKNIGLLAEASPSNILLAQIHVSLEERRHGLASGVSLKLKSGGLKRPV